MDTIACGYPSLLLSHLSLSGNKSHFNGLQKPLSPLIEGTCSQSLIFFEAFLPSSSEKVNSFEIRALFFYVVCLCSGSVSWPTERTVMGSLPKPLPFLRGKKLIIFNFILHSKLLLNQQRICSSYEGCFLHLLSNVCQHRAADRKCFPLRLYGSDCVSYLCVA